MSYKHLSKYMGEFAGRHNTRKLNTLKQMCDVVKNIADKNLKYKDLVA